MAVTVTVVFTVVFALVCGCLGTCIPWGGLRKKEDAFHEAVLDGDYATVKRFLEGGKPPDAPGLDPKGAPALLDALASNNLRMADLLFAHGADVNRIWWGQPLIFHTVRNDEVKAYRWLLKHGAKPNADTLALLKLPSGERFVVVSNDGLLHYPER